MTSENPGAKLPDEGCFSVFEGEVIKISKDNVDKINDLRADGYTIVEIKSLDPVEQEPGQWLPKLEVVLRKGEQTQEVGLTWTEETFDKQEKAIIYAAKYGKMWVEQTF